MYAREIDGETHSFGVSGKLIMNALVMFDYETLTLWSQFLGEAVRGELKGTKLEFLPVTHTTWELWLEAQPNTQVLDKNGGYRFDSYDGYYRGGSAGVIDERITDNRLDRKELLVGVRAGDATKAFPFEELRRSRVVNDAVGDLPVVVFFEAASETGLAYDREVDGRLLTFSLVGEGTGAAAAITDAETGTVWRVLSGRGVQGPLAGKTLKRAESFLSFWFAWKDWNPDTEIWVSDFGPDLTTPTPR